jgi:hypothetical protein
MCVLKKGGSSKSCTMIEVLAVHGVEDGETGSRRYSLLVRVTTILGNSSRAPSLMAVHRPKYKPLTTQFASAITYRDQLYLGHLKDDRKRSRVLPIPSRSSVAV